MATITYSDHQETYGGYHGSSPLDQYIQAASTGYSFQTRVVLQQIVAGEQQRIKDEQMLWRVGGSLLGLCFGLSDGFQLTDMFIGMSAGAVGGLAYDTMSHEDRKFLEQCQSLWLVGCNSPMELQQRLGPAKSRIVIDDPSIGQPLIFNHHQGHRGDHLVPLGDAGDVALGFQHQQSLDVMSRHISPENIGILRSQFYPIADYAMPVECPIPISHNDLDRSGVSVNSTSPYAQPVGIKSAHGSCIAYQVPIPAHSDF